MRGKALLVALVAVLALQGCREAETSSPPLQSPLSSQSDPLAELTKFCAKGGGRLATVGKGQVCFYDTRDAGRQCSRATDCESECLARSGSCAPVRPLLGCNEILMNEGQRAMLCRD